jgi:hypothetical protein
MKQKARRRDAHAVGGQEIGRPRRMHVEHENHRRRLDAFVDEVVSDMDLHDRFLLTGWRSRISAAKLVDALPDQSNCEAPYMVFAPRCCHIEPNKDLPK